MNNTLRDLYQHIEKIKQEEQVKRTLAKYIDAHMMNLHKAVTINSSSHSTAIFEFITLYIDSAPDYLNAIDTLAINSKVYSYVKPFTTLAYMFFIKSPELLVKYQGLQRLLYQAYLSNRLLEELNDKITSFGYPLSPLDISMDNIICHALIGDELANQLDHLVLLSLETTVSDKSVFDKPEVIKILIEMSENSWQRVKDKWPCFTNDLSINLQLGTY